MGSEQLEDSHEETNESQDTNEGTEAQPSEGALQTEATASEAVTQHEESQLAHASHVAGWTTNRLSGSRLFNGPHNPAATTASGWRSSRLADATSLDAIANQPKGIWLVRSIDNISSYVSGIANSAQAAGEVPLYVLYGMRSVSCDDRETGPTVTGYYSWVQQIAAATGNTKSIIIIEPDELALNHCGADKAAARQAIVRKTVTLLQKANHELYIDIGHGNWLSVENAASILRNTNVQATNGFALNVSNYHTTASNKAFGDALSVALGGAHYVIDTSRNGNGPDDTFEWCNARGRALGELPKALSIGSKLDAYLWVKYPGESDGTCNGGPAEGQWWPEYALDLARKAGY